jgi:hypothetical protein
MKAIINVPNEMRDILDSWEDGASYQLDVTQTEPWVFELVDARPLETPTGEEQVAAGGKGTQTTPELPPPPPELGPLGEKAAQLFSAARNA